MHDAIVVGGGPNGLSAAVALAAAGHSVLVLEANPTIGGGARTAELTVPGVLHDVCSAVHPLGVGSAAMGTLELDRHGLSWAHPPIPMAHPLDDGSAALLHRDYDETLAGLGQDGATYRRTFGNVLKHWDRSIELALSPPLAALRHPIAGARFGLLALQPASWLARRFHTDRGRAMVAGLGAHTAAPLSTIATSGVALVLGAAAHARGWPVARGGSGAIAEALAGKLREMGGEVRVNSPVTSLDDLPPHRVALFDTSPRAMADIAGGKLSWLRRRRHHSFPRGPGVFKVDATLSEPIPWTNEQVRRAGTIHVGGTFEEIARAEALVAKGKHPDRPFVLVAQPVIADPTRAPQGTHVLWAYCHVPSGSTRDMTEAIFGQIERFAPGFRDTVREVAVKDTVALERDNANLIAGDITGGEMSLRGLFARPTLFNPYRAAKGLYLCSASTPPGAGVHGMCGIHAARRAMRELRRR